MAMDILDPRLGVQSILPPAEEASHLPSARPIAVNVMAEGSVAELGKLNDFSTIIRESFAPIAFQSEWLRPDVLGRNLAKARKTLKKSRNPDVRRFVRDDFDSLMDDVELYNAYSGLLVEG
ncbi:MAG: hypothetical protein LBV23_11870 [Deltaproteobacteria bacterium]|nr:hypothetical protein [Deltaproteobacteria bacterium]